MRYELEYCPKHTLEYLQKDRTQLHSPCGSWHKLRIVFYFPHEFKHFLSENHTDMRVNKYTWFCVFYLNHFNLSLWGNNFVGDSYAKFCPHSETSLFLPSLYQLKSGRNKWSIETSINYSADALEHLQPNALLILALVALYPTPLKVIRFLTINWTLIGPGNSKWSKPCISIF